MNAKKHANNGAVRFSSRPTPSDANYSSEVTNEQIKRLDEFVRPEIESAEWEECERAW